MIAVGYMYKLICSRPDWLTCDTVKDIYSVSSCISADFDDWINEWQHNGYWLFNTPEAMESIANRKKINLTGMKLFFYNATDKQWHEGSQEWQDYQAEESFNTDVRLPKDTKLEGYDVVSYCANSACECSPLSCNHLADSWEVNKHCLLRSYDEAVKLLQSGQLKDCEPGPYRIFEVHSVIAR